MALPNLTEEQRKAALEKAAEARKARAAVKQRLKNGSLSLKEILQMAQDPTVAKMRVSAVLESLPGVGKVRARKLMEEVDISITRRVKGLGEKQKVALLARFDEQQ